MSAQRMWTDSLGRSYEYSPAQPAPLAEKDWGFSAEVTLALAEAAGVLGGVPQVPVAGIATVLYRSESSASSLIEGVGPGTRRILEAEFADEAELDDEPARRVVGNLAALGAAIATPVPASVDDMLDWHRLLMEGHPQMRPETIGSIRTRQNWIGGDAFGPRDAEYIPPPPEDVLGLMQDLVSFCRRTDLPSIALAGIAHAQFEVIHPFVDGNGRVGRVLLQQVLVQRSGLESPVPISVPWSRDTGAYIDALRAFQGGDTHAWLVFVCWSVIEAVNWMRQMTDRVESLLASYRSRIATRGRSVTARVIDNLPDHPVVDTPSVAARYGVTSQTAHAALMRLVESGVLTERSFSRRRRGRPRRVLASPELIDLLGSL